MYMCTLERIDTEFLNQIGPDARNPAFGANEHLRSRARLCFRATWSAPLLFALRGEFATCELSKF